MRYLIISRLRFAKAHWIYSRQEGEGKGRTCANWEDSPAGPAGSNVKGKRYVVTSSCSLVTECAGLYLENFGVRATWTTLGGIPRWGRDSRSL